MGTRCAVLIVMFGVGTACDSAERREAQSVVMAVRRFRTADNESTPAMVEALRGTPCSTHEVCEARDACVAVGEVQAKALRLKVEVERGVAALEKGALAKDSAEAKVLPQKLDEAESLLRQGHEGLGKCDERVAALKRRLRI